MNRTLDIALVFMPYGRIDRPVIGLGYLAAALQQADLNAAVIHGNLAFAEHLGLPDFNVLMSSSYTDLLGEWTFAGAAFPAAAGAHDEYFRGLSTRLSAAAEAVVRRARSLARPFTDELADRILSQRPRMVGCSSMFQQNTASLALLRRIRELDPEVITVMGGANCEAELGRALHSFFPWLDYVFSGESEELFPKFCRRLLFGSDVEPIADGEAWPPPSVFTPESRRLGVRRPAGVEMIMDLNRLPLPRYDDYFRDLGNSGLAGQFSPVMMMETSRGCWWGEKHKCTFCGLHDDTIRFRSKSADVAFREIDQLFEKHRIRFYEMVDSVMDSGYYDTLLPRLASDPRQLQFFYEIKTNVTHEQVRVLADAGVVSIQPGLEGLNDRLLKLMGKGQRVYQNLRLLKWCRHYGIYVMWNYLRDLPGEQDEWHRDELEMIPLLHHLQAPSDDSRSIRFDRFSVYCTRPEAFGLALVPSQVYRHIYPLDTAQLRELAYFFDNQQTAVVNGGHPQPVMSRLCELMSEWRRLYYVTKDDEISFVANERGPELRMTDGDHGQLIITDTRPCALQPVLDLDGLAAAIYRICDPGEIAAEVVAKVRANGFAGITSEQVAEVLAELIGSKTMLFVSGRYLSLAVQWPYRAYASFE